MQEKKNVTEEFEEKKMTLDEKLFSSVTSSFRLLTSNKKRKSFVGLVLRGRGLISDCYIYIYIFFSGMTSHKHVAKQKSWYNFIHILHTQYGYTREINSGSIWWCHHHSGCCRTEVLQHWLKTLSQLYPNKVFSFQYLLLITSLFFFSCRSANTTTTTIYVQHIPTI